MKKLKLISKPECPFCWKVKLALAYIQVDYDLYDFVQPEAEFLQKYSPQQSVPILIDGNQALWDSAAIIYYLEDMLRNNVKDMSLSLFPGNLEERSMARHLDIYSSSIIGPRLREVVFEKRDKAPQDWDLNRIDLGMAAWKETWSWLEKQHSGEKYFIGAGYSLAECALLPRFALAERYGVEIQEVSPKLFQWYKYWREQPLFRETLPWENRIN